MARALLGASLFAAALGGCVVVSGGTGGYTPVDAGIPVCGATSDCGSGQLCCLVVSFSSGTGSVACQTPDGSSGCTGGDFAVELCTTDAECGDAGACITQQCSVGAAPTRFGVCKQIPGVCAIVPSPGNDAASAADAASVTDAASASDHAAPAMDASSKD